MTNLVGPPVAIAIAALFAAGAPTGMLRGVPVASPLKKITEISALVFPDRAGED